MRRDLMNTIHPVVALSPQVATDNTALVTGAVDTDGYQSVTFVIATGDIADSDATFDVTIKDGDNSTQTEHVQVGESQILGTEDLAGFDFSADNACRKIGYTGVKRYCSIEITPTGNTGNAPIAVIAILGHPDYQETPNPPA